MSVQIERLLIIQERDRRIAQLEREQRDIPTRCEQIESRLHAHRESIQAAQESLKKHLSEIKNIEVEVDARRQKIAKFRQQQFEIKSNTEYKALEHEISIVEGEIRGLEDRELALMEETEQLRQMVSARQGDSKQEESRVREEQETLKKRLAQIQAEVEGIRKDRQALTADVDPAWLSRYERIMHKTGDYAIVRIETNACGGCHMNLTPSTLHEARRDITLVQCGYCTRILYWEPH